MHQNIFFERFQRKTGSSFTDQLEFINKHKREEKQPKMDLEVGTFNIHCVCYEHFLNLQKACLYSERD